MACQCGTTATAEHGADAAHSGCGCGTGADPDGSGCECGTTPAATEEASLARIVMELDKRVRRLESSAR